MSLATFHYKYKTNMLIVYCDPKDKKTYNKILASMVRARREVPINLKPEADTGAVQNKQRHSDVIFVLASVPNLMPLTKIREVGRPQAFFFTPEDNFINLFNTTLSRVERVEGLS
mmetsp:Transcript_14789/g.10693  ORF Transcript_14789/g.10693 Transcript_14789/m.10693 type:complete len:115 (-) Transcript_14789:597-941(-)